MNLQFDLDVKTAPAIFLNCEPLNELELRLHSEAIARANRFLEDEARLLEVIMEVDQTRLYFKFDLSSTFSYCVKYLRLSEAVAYNFIAVARKAAEVPALKAAIESGDFGVSKARKIVSVLTHDNQKDWIKKASELTQAKLEREVVESSPLSASSVRERVRAVKNSSVQIELQVTEALMRQLRQVQDLVSESQSKNVTLEETLAAMIDLYLQRKDPIRKAKRAEERRQNREARDVAVSDRSCSRSLGNSQDNSCDELKDRPPTDRPLKEDQGKGIGNRKVKVEVEGKEREKVQSQDQVRTETQAQAQAQTERQKQYDCQSREQKHEKAVKRKPIPAAVEHALHLRDQRCCQTRRADGSVCGSTRYVQIHHLIPVAKGGTNDLSNLITLCGRCHRQWHRQNE